MALSVAFRSNYFISDVVVVSRAWIMWSNSPTAKATLIVCICGSAVGVFVECVWTLKLDFDMFGYFAFPIHRLMMIVPLLFTNVVSTAL